VVRIWFGLEDADYVCAEVCNAWCVKLALGAVYERRAICYAYEVSALSEDFQVVNDADL
jgi:hypothetical protein